MDQQNQPITKKCPFCANEILIDAIKCEYCGEFLNIQSTTITKPFSNAQPIWQFVILTTLTFGLYEIYWFYRNWKCLKAHKNLDIRPGWRTVGLFIPIYGFVLIYEQFRDIRDFSKDAGIEKTFSPGLILFTWMVITALWRLPDPYWLISLLSVCPLAVVQGLLNSYWEKEQSGLSIRTKLSGGQIAVVIIGGIIFILGIIGTFLPE